MWTEQNPIDGVSMADIRPSFLRDRYDRRHCTRLIGRFVKVWQRTLTIDERRLPGLNATFDAQPRSIRDVPGNPQR